MPSLAPSASRADAVGWLFEPSRRFLFGCLAILVVIAWFAAWRLGGAGALGLHHGPAHGVGAPAKLSLLFLLGWTTMTVAMMLPTTIPLLTIFQAVVSSRSDRGWLIALVIAGYLLVWSFFGGVVFLGERLLHRLLVANAWWLAHPNASTSAILLVAGGYQFTALKYRCLDKCRSPMSFVIAHWSGRNQRWQSFRLGADHGVFCIGCCWALMLLMFIVGIGHLAWMLMLGTIMAAEKNLPGGRRLSAPLGAVLITAGLAVFTFG